MVENLPANAGDMGSIPGLGRSHMPSAAITEANAPRARAPQQATTMRSPCTTKKSSPHSLQLEKACAQQ